MIGLAVLHGKTQAYTNIPIILSSSDVSEGDPVTITCPRGDIDTWILTIRRKPLEDGTRGGAGMVGGRGRGRGGRREVKVVEYLAPRALLHPSVRYQGRASFEDDTLTLHHAHAANDTGLYRCVIVDKSIKMYASDYVRLQVIGE